MISEIKEGFKGRISAFERLAIIYEKQKQYNEALKVCDVAIEYYQDLKMYAIIEQFERRKKRLSKNSTPK